MLTACNTKVALYMRKPSFGHGQLYVGGSRVGEDEGLIVFGEGGVTDDQGAFLHQECGIQESADR